MILKNTLAEVMHAKSFCQKSKNKNQIHDHNDPHRITFFIVCQTSKSCTSPDYTPLKDDFFFFYFSLQSCLQYLSSTPKLSYTHSSATQLSTQLSTTKVHISTSGPGRESPTGWWLWGFSQRWGRLADGSVVCLTDCLMDGWIALTLSFFCVSVCGHHLYRSLFV